MCWAGKLFPSLQCFLVMQQALRLGKCAAPHIAKSKGFNVRPKSAEAEKYWEIHLQGSGNQLLPGAVH